MEDQNYQVSKMETTTSKSQVASFRRPLRSRRKKSSKDSPTTSSSSNGVASRGAPPAHISRRSELSICIPPRISASHFFNGLEVFERLNREGFYVLDNFISEETSGFASKTGISGVSPSSNFLNQNGFLENICNEARKIFLERRFGEDGKLAGTNGDDVLDHRKRSDLTFTLPWNDKHVIYHCLPSFQQLISVLRETLVPTLEQGLSEFKRKAGSQERNQLYWPCLEETNQLALLENPSLSCFPQERNAYFRRHLDSHFRINHGSKNMFSPVIDKRKLTILFYLNRNWNLGTDGGALRMWVGPESFPNNLTEPRGEVVEVAPLLNRLLIFWSDSVPHEVHATSRDRYAATLWLAEVSQ